MTCRSARRPISQPSLEPQVAATPGQGRAERIGEDLVIRIDWHLPIDKAKQLCLGLIDGAKQPSAGGAVGGAPP